MNQEKRKVFWKKVLLISLVVFFIFILISVINYFYISNYSEKYLYNDLEKLPKNKVGLLLGTTPVHSNQLPNPFFVARMYAAKQILWAEKIDYILVSGDNREVSYNEPKYMKNYLEKIGVSSTSIIADYAGRRTLDSVLRSQKIFQQNQITIISQKYHNQRAIFIARKNNIQALAFNADSESLQNNWSELNLQNSNALQHQNDLEKFLENCLLSFKIYFREILARDLASLDILLNRQPEILGDRIEIPDYDFK